MSKNTFRIVVIVIMATALTLLVGCGGTAKLTNKTARELFDIGMKSYADKKYLQAIEAFQAVVYNHAGESMVDTAQYHLALSYFSNRDYALAGVEFNRLIVNYPASIYYTNAIFMRAVCFFEGTPGHYGLDQTDLKKAIDQFEDFVIDFPESELVPEAQAYLSAARNKMAKKFYESGIVYKHIGGLVAAQKYFQIVIDDYTDTEFAPLSLFEYTALNMKLKKYAEAQAGFENFVKIFTDHKLAADALKLAREAAFKSGEFAFEKGEYDTAKQRFEAFIKDYPNDKRVNNALEYLSKIEDKQSLLTEDGHADS